ncbi:MAG: glutamate synthase, partial [Anaerolineales bacterium]
DRYWNARGGSHTDGGAFIFEVRDQGSGKLPTIEVYDKFGEPVPVPVSTSPYAGHAFLPEDGFDLPKVGDDALFGWIKGEIKDWCYGTLRAFLDALVEAKSAAGEWGALIEILTLMMDRRYDTGCMRRSSVLSLVDQAFEKVIDKLAESEAEGYVFVHVGGSVPAAGSPAEAAVIEARGYEPEGEKSVANEIQRLYEKGFRWMLVTHARGHRFFGVGLGPETKGLRIDAYGSPGDYLASGIDGLEIHVHNNAQDQLAQIMKSGKLVVHGDVGQTFMYGAKGGEAYILGNAAGRPLINAVGKPRVVINGTCLDYLAESFMAGDPLNGGGFVILNGITFDESNQIVELETPYPGGNLFSLASGGAIYVRDPNQVVTEEQLNGGEFSAFTEADWALIRPYLEENERLLDVPVSRMLTVEGVEKAPAEVYRKIRPATVRALQAEESWVTEDSAAH